MLHPFWINSFQLSTKKENTILSSAMALFQIIGDPN